MGRVMAQRLTHADEAGAARMVNVGEKPITCRVAIAEGRVLVRPKTLEAIRKHQLQKGEALGVARVAGIMAAKRCGEIIPLCHTLQLSAADLAFSFEDDPPAVAIRAETSCEARTGAEMEALTAVSVAALTLYDMIKAIDRSAVITEIRLLRKSGGKSGDYAREVEHGAGAVG